MIVLYSTGCPKCAVLKKKLEQKKVSFTTITKEEDIISDGITEVPVLKINGKIYDFSTAIGWLNSLEDN